MPKKPAMINPTMKKFLSRGEARPDKQENVHPFLKYKKLLE